MLKIYLSLLLTLIHIAVSEKCYSCSSAQMSLRWPKDEENRLLYLSDFPWFANETCDLVKGALPVVDCPNSVCIKAVINEEPAKREVCAEGGAIVRDCWSRVIKYFDAADIKAPKSRWNQVRLTDDSAYEHTIGVLYTCEGFLCNAAFKPSALYGLPLLIRTLLR